MPDDTSSGAALPHHVFDPLTQPHLFEGVLARRILAFLIDVIVITAPVVLASIFIFLFGVLTIGLGWMLFGLLSPAAVLWAIFYYGMTLGGPYSATLGMRALSLEMRTWTGARPYFVLGAVHAILFWVSVSFLTPLVLLVGLVNQRKRLLHDIVVGAVVLNRAGLPGLSPQSTARSIPAGGGGF
jgi:uncharacterized RDD family membrane protein YckC